MDDEQQATFLRYASIPLMAALIGYFTNVLAIQMTFLPLEYFGWGEATFRKYGFSFGWQATRSTLRGQCAQSDP